MYIGCLLYNCFAENKNNHSDLLCKPNGLLHQYIHQYYLNTQLHQPNFLPSPPLGRMHAFKVGGIVASSFTVATPALQAQENVSDCTRKDPESWPNTNSNETNVNKTCWRNKRTQEWQTTQVSSPWRTQVVQLCRRSHSLIRLGPGRSGFVWLGGCVGRLWIASCHGGVVKRAFTRFLRFSFETLPLDDWPLTTRPTTSNHQSKWCVKVPKTT